VNRFLRIAKYAVYPALYVFCLFLFGYLSFPYDRLKDRLIAEFQAAQKGKSAGQRLEIDELDSYWFTGVEMTGIRLYLPPDDSSGGATAAASFGAFGAGASGGDKPTAKESVIEIDDAVARVQILPLLIGRVRVKFTAHAFGGEVNGTVPVGGTNGPVEVELENVDLGQVAMLKDMIGVPLKGIANGVLALEAADGKFSKANGKLELTVAGVSVGDGKSKIKGMIALPEAKLGDLVMTAEAKDGILKVSKLEGNGSDLELAGDGKVNVREPWNSSNADLYVRFKFTDAYRNKSDLTKSLLGAPGSTAPSMLDMADPRIKRAKRDDGFYGWHIHGALKRLKFDPASTDGPASRARGKSGDSPFTTKKPSTPSFGKSDGDAPEPPSMEPPVREPPRERAPDAPPPQTAPPAVPPPVQEAPAAPLPTPEPAPAPTPAPAAEDPQPPPGRPTPTEQ